MTEDIETLRAALDSRTALLETAGDAIIVVDGQGTVLEWNRAAEALFGYSAPDMIGADVAQIVPERYRQAHQRGLTRLAAGGPAHLTETTSELVGLRADGTEFPLELSLSQWNDRHGPRFASIIRDISARQRAASALRRERELLVMLEAIAIEANAAETVADALQGALEAVCRWTGWPVGHAFLVGADGSDQREALASPGAWFAADQDRYRALHDASASLTLGPGQGLPGQVVQAGAPVELLLSLDLDLPRIQVLVEAGLDLGYGFPILVGREVVGALEFYTPLPAPVVGNLAEVMGNVTAQIGRAVERDRTGVATRLRTEQQLAHMRLHDPLTGLPQRHLFSQNVARALERGHRHGWWTTVIALDLDDFGALNDRLGTEVGDLVLVAVARRLTEVLRPYDAVSRSVESVARAGSDEFMLLCEHVDGPDTAARIAERALVAVTTALEGLVGPEATLTATAGIAVVGPDERDPGVAVADAAAALQRAKEQGPASYAFFSDSIRAQSRQRAGLRQDLERALDQAQFRLHYQPKVRVATGQIVGAEALVRWEHPGRGLIAPGEFIPVAEQTGLIVALGAWVLHEACRQAAAWSAELPDRTPLLMSVNVSALQFRTDLLQTVRSALDETGLPATQLCLEVTESVVMDDVEHAIEILRELKAMGVSLSVDDFGTGYSSLAYLKRLPLDELKIDRSFVGGLGSDAEDTAIAAAVTAMAHALGLSVVAEGVETSLQLERLRMIGCDIAQGYFFSRPVPAVAMTELLTADWTTSAGTPSGGLTVLVADDAPAVLLLAAISLATAGFEVHQAVDGRAALELARQLRPDCLVLDVQMPYLTGYEVCRAVRADPLLASCTVLLLTAGAGSDDKVQGFMAGADDYLVKPFTPRDLVARIHHARTARASRQRGTTG